MQPYSQNLTTKTGLLCRFLFIALVMICSQLAVADDWAFTNYVERCQYHLEFDTLPQMDCRDINFRPPTTRKFFAATNDWVNYKKVNDSVDAVFACRWVMNDTGDSMAETGEMIVHNRRNGNTCYFALKRSATLSNGSKKIPTTNPVSPTHKDAVDYWEDLSEKLDERAICTNCHAAGPYIASKEIVGALQKYGLINDGHDTFNDFYRAIDPEPNPRFQGAYREPIDNAVLDSCASECHKIANKPFEKGCSPSSTSWPACDTLTNSGTNIVMPSINQIIQEMLTNGEMPPDDPHSDFRWMNRDTGESGYGDYERLEDYQRDKEEGLRDYSEFYCNNPKRTEAHRVKSGIKLRSDNFIDEIRTFNLHDGLICYNSDQASNQSCHNYETRYKCDGNWTAWGNTDSPGGNVDTEARSRYEDKYGLCSNPSDIQARYKPNGTGSYKTVYGPRDRLRNFSNKGLYCRNEDQPSGKKCNNYVVRFICD